MLIHACIAQDAIIFNMSPKAHVQRLQDEVARMRVDLQNAITPEGKYVLEESLQEAIEKVCVYLYVYVCMYVYMYVCIGNA